MPPETTLWNLEPHTIGKHLVLKNYMNAWLPIMSSWNGRVLFIDAFAGPGEYSGGEPGSPKIALHALIEHTALQRMTNEFVYVFIEEKLRRYEYLRALLSDMQDEIPSNCTYNVINSTFDETLTEVLDRLDEQRSNLAPALVMIDPFGVSDTPMETVRRILGNPKAEVYISFMYDFINRFKDNPRFEPHLDKLFGTRDWRTARTIQDEEARKHAFYGLYTDQLKVAGAKYVINSELYEGNRLVYTIFFGKSGLKGCDKMKEAIWKVAPFGDYCFRGNLVGQLSMGPSMVDFDPLRRSLHEEFNGAGWVHIETVEDFVMSDKTEFDTGHLKSNALKPMENDGSIEILQGSRRQRGTYPPGTKLRFLAHRRNEAIVQRLF